MTGVIIEGGAECDGEQEAFGDDVGTQSGRTCPTVHQPHGTVVQLLDGIRMLWIKTDSDGIWLDVRYI